MFDTMRGMGRLAERGAEAEAERLEAEMAEVCGVLNAAPDGSSA